MIRKTILSGVLAAGSLAGVSFLPSSADAHPPAVGPAYRPVTMPSYYPPATHPAFPQIRGTGYYPPAGHDWDRGHAHFQVLVRHHGHWDLYRTVHDRDDAQRLAHRLRHQGYDVDVRRSWER